MTKHPNRRRRDRPGDRLHGLGANMIRAPELTELPELVALIVRLWAELHEADAALARELARKLPTARINRG